MKEVKSQDELAAIVLRELQSAGLPGVTSVAINRIVDRSVDFNWSVSGVGLGNESEAEVQRVLQSKAISLLSRYELPAL